MADVPTIRGQITRTQYRAGRRRSLQALAANVTSPTGNVVNTSSTVPNAHATRVQTTTTQTIPSGSPGSLTNSFTTESYDTDNWWIVGSPTKITVDQAGIYLLQASVSISNAAAQPTSLYFKKNGSTSIGFSDSRTLIATDNTTLQYSMLVSLAVSDYVEVIAETTGGSAQSVTAAEFSVTLIGLA